MRKHRIVILGGGIAGLSSALALTDRPGWEHDYDISILQMGWRLGGKCASGRGPNGRIEEHGIHLFGGGYYNTLAAMERCYAELNAHPEGWPLRFEQAFEPQYHSLSWAVDGDTLRRSEVDFPVIGTRIGAGGHAGFVRAVLAQLVRVMKGLFERNFDPGQGPLVERMQPLSSRLIEALFEDGQIVLDKLLALIEGSEPLAEEALKWVQHGAGLLRRIDASSLFESFESLARPLPSAQRWLQAVERRLADAVTMGDYLAALLRGVVDDRVLQRGFEALDDENWAAWLRRHGASAATVASTIACAPLNILYQYPQGDRAQVSMGAGAYLHWVLRSFGYEQAPFWFFEAGTGDTVIAPLYTLLRRRGVRFEFFQRVTALRPDAGQTRVARVEIEVQAELQGAEYLPLFTCGALQSWPNRPDYGQLTHAETLSRQAADFESDWNPVPSQRQRTLHARADAPEGSAEAEIYDTLLFAISLGAVPHLCPDFIAHKPAWRDLVAHLPTVETQSLQLWLRKSSPDLGVDIHPRRETNDTALACGYRQPFDGLVDFSPLLAWENWPSAGRPRSLWYFSDVLRHPAAMPAVGSAAGRDYPAQRAEAVRQTGFDFVQRQLAPLLPKAMSPAGFRFELLASHTPLAPEAPATERFSQQYWRANVEPSERYVTAPVGSTRYRLRAWESGYDNLVLAGDWTRNGLNVGCVEATVMSGMLAAHAISGQPALDRVIGYCGPQAPRRGSWPDAG